MKTSLTYEESGGGGGGGGRVHQGRHWEHQMEQRQRTGQAFGMTAHSFLFVVR